MAGIDNITNAILQEAKEKAASVISAAESKAAESRAAAEREGKELSGKIAEKAARDAKIYGERIESQAGMLKKQAALTAKQEIINGVIDAACEKLRKQGDADYLWGSICVLKMGRSCSRQRILAGFRPDLPMFFQSLLRRPAVRWLFPKKPQRSTMVSSFATAELKKTVH